MKTEDKILKQQFFAQYWGQNVHTDECYDGKHKFNNGFLVELENTYGWLNLKPLSNISNEDAIEVVNSGHTIEFLEGGWRVKGTQVTFEYTPQKVDFLRSKGYAVPWMSISVEKQIKLGWIKLI